MTRPEGRKKDEVVLFVVLLGGEEMSRIQRSGFLVRRSYQLSALCPAKKSYSPKGEYGPLG